MEFHGSHPQHGFCVCAPPPSPFQCSCGVCGGALPADAPAGFAFRCVDDACLFWLCAKCKAIDETPLPEGKVYCVLADARYETVRTRPRDTATAVGSLSRDTVHVVVSSTTSAEGDMWLRFEGGGWILAAAVSQLENEELLPSLVDRAEPSSDDDATDEPLPWKLMLTASDALFRVHETLTSETPTLDARAAMGYADVACAVLQDCADLSVAAKSLSKRGDFLECGTPDDAACGRAAADALMLWDVVSEFVDLTPQRRCVAPYVVQCLPLMMSVLDAAAVRDAISAQAAATAVHKGMPRDSAVLPPIDRYLRPTSLQFVRLHRGIVSALQWIASVPRADESVKDILMVSTKLLCGGSYFCDDDRACLAFCAAMEALLSRCRPATREESQHLAVNADVLEVVVRIITRTQRADLATRCVAVLQQLWYQQPELWRRHSRWLRSPLAANVNKWSSNLTVNSPTAMIGVALRAVSAIVTDPSWPHTHLVHLPDRYALLCDDCLASTPGLATIFSRPTAVARCSNRHCKAHEAAVAKADGDSSREAKLIQCLDAMMSLNDIDACADLALGDAGACFSHRVVSRVLFKAMQQTLPDLVARAPSVALLLVQGTLVCHDTIDAACTQFSTGTLIADLRAALQPLNLADEDARHATTPPRPLALASDPSKYVDPELSMFERGSPRPSEGAVSARMANTSSAWLDYSARPEVDDLASAVRSLQLVD